MLKIESLSVSYGSNQVIKDLDLQLDNDMIHGLVGLNGSGKTTLLNAAVGLVNKDAGSVTFNGEPLSINDAGYLETTNFFYPRIKGMEYLKLFKWKNPAFDIEAWNNVFELPLNDLIETYSTGMKKKLALLGIISLNKQLLMLDEPFNGLDMEANIILVNIIRSLKGSGKTIILTSHILDPLIAVCDDIHYLNEGRIYRSFNKNEFDSIGGILEGTVLKNKIGLAQELIKKEF